MALPSAVASHFAMPAMSEAPHESVSSRRAVSLSFTAHPHAVVERPSGRTDAVAVAPGSGSITGGEAIAWVRVDEPYEGVELVPEPALLAALARELRAPTAADLGDVPLREDPVLWAAAVRVRAHALGTAPLSDLEGDELAHGLFAHLIRERLGGRAPRGVPRPLDDRRLARVSELVEARLGEPLGVGALAAEAGMPPLRFLDAFRAATGLAPHGFVAARRLARARALMAGAGLGGPDLAALAAALGPVVGEAAPAALRAPDPRLAAALGRIDAGLSEPLSVAELAEAAAMSPSHFARAFRASMGEAVWAHVQRRRCERAREMLRTTRLPLAEVAYACGFASQAHLTTSLRRRYGATPGALRRGAAA